MNAENLYTVKGVLTPKKSVCVWERGGSYTNRGYSEIWAMPDGSMPMAMYIRTTGHRACKHHALLKAQVGMYMIRCNRHRDEMTITVGVVTGLITNPEDKREAMVVTMNVYHGENNLWDIKPPEELEIAIEYAKDKAHTYHCKTPFYVKSPMLSSR